MKLYKHTRVLLDIIIKILEHADQKRIGRKELCQKINNNMSDKRLTINNRQLSKLLKKQKEYNIKQWRYHYEIEKTKDNNEKKCEEDWSSTVYNKYCIIDSVWGADIQDVKRQRRDK